MVHVGQRASFGGAALAVCAGPCSVESREQLEACAGAVAQAGANVLRGGAFKPRTSPYAFQGLGEEGLRYLRETADRFGLAVVTEVLDPRDVELVLRYADMLQIGMRNMQNFALLREVGRTAKPVLLKRGIAATIEEWLMAAEYVVAGGNPHVVLCERGIRGFDPQTRNVLDLAAVPVVQSLTHLPVIVDPSHGTGVRGLVIPMTMAAVAAGADGVIVEVHPYPARAYSDGAQSLTLPGFGELMERLGPVAAAVGRALPSNAVAAA
ncbi:MAG: 3-deoxy-7-phosphoheptulonate synthase [Candidatus Eremiobacteraeota bacterium]|nr:3-deoxy-7-phosphoheptulonate synthase [Candidatus Eremiobacteraeota bacterium]